MAQHEPFFVANPMTMHSLVIFHLKSNIGNGTAPRNAETTGV